MLCNPRAALVLALFCGAVLGGFVLYHHPPGSSWITPPCMMNKLTGLHCPGCGSTRATYALLHGDILEALKKNIVFVVALPFLVWWTGRAVWRWVQHRPSPPNTQARLELRARVSWALVAIIILFSVLRNLPWAPFNWLAPH